MRVTRTLVLWTALLMPLRGLAQTYVSTAGSNEYPYRRWETAARSIQDAIDASAECSVFVGPGEYAGNIYLPEHVMVWGAGARSCLIRGVPPGDPELVSVARLAPDALLSGFTIIAQGCYNGLMCQGAEVRDCVVIGARSVGVCASDSIVQGCVALGNAYAGIYASGVSVLYDTVVSGGSTGLYRTGNLGYVLLLHCTITGNRYGVDNLDGGAISMRDSIVWGNALENFSVDFLPSQVIGCDTSDPRFAARNGNVSENPLFVGWGDFNDAGNPMYVDCSNTGEQDGTKDKPFRTIGAALRAYDFHLAAGSPCIGAASDGLNMGAYPHDVPSRQSSPSVLINIAPGTYKEGELMFLDGTHLRAAVPARANMSPPPYDTGLWLNGNSSIEGLCIGVNLGTAVACTSGSNPVITRCRIFPYALDAYSAAVRAWEHDARPTIAGCVVGGFDTAIAGSAVLEGCTLVDNKTAVLGPDDGEAPQIRNSIVWSAASNWASALVNVPSSNISHCLVSDPSLDGVNGIIFADPHFVNPQGGEFRLGPDSPCVDAGDNNAPDLPETDFAGMHRIMFGGKSLTVDMGAYEFYINKVEPVPPTKDVLFTWSSLADRTYSIFYSDDLFTWHLAIENFPSFGNTTTSWLDDGTLTGIPPCLVPKRFYRLLENPSR